MTLSPEHAVASAPIHIFIGGFLDRSSHIVCNYRKMFRQVYQRHTTFYFEYDQCREIIAAVVMARTADPAASIKLVGHSWGAVTAINAANQLAAKGIHVDHVITIDPVGRKRVGVAASATAWINVNAAPATSNGWNGDYYALLGGKWDDWPRGKASVHLWAPFHHNEFGGLLEYVALDGECAFNCLVERRRPAN